MWKLERNNQEKQGSHKNRRENSGIKEIQGKREEGWEREGTAE